jgi:hypothetical protein
MDCTPRCGKQGSEDDRRDYRPDHLHSSGRIRNRRIVAAHPTRPERGAKNSELGDNAERGGYPEDRLRERAAQYV